MSGGLCGVVGADEWIVRKQFQAIMMELLQQSDLRDGESKKSLGAKGRDPSGELQALSPLLFTIVLETLSREFRVRSAVEATLRR